MLDLKQVQNQYMRCNEAVLATVAQYYSHNFEMMFLDAWYFDFDASKVEKTGIVANGIVHLASDFSANFEKYHQIKVSIHDFNNKVDIIDFVKSQMILNKLTAVIIDSYYLEDAPQNEKESRLKAPYLIAGFDKNIVYCLDIHRRKKIVPIDLAIILSGCNNSCFSFEVIREEDDMLFVNSFYNSLIQSKRTGLCSNIFEAIDKFSDCIESFLDNGELNGEKDIVKSDLFDKLTYIISSRELYGLTLQFLGKKFNNPLLLQIVDSFHKLASDWTTVRSLVQRSFINQSILSSRKKIADKIKYISKFEEDISERMSNIELKLDSSIARHYQKKQILSSSIENGFDVVDINQYLNNKAIATNKDDYLMADISSFGEGAFFLVEGFPKSNLLSVKNILFKIYAYDNKAYDNIACMNQIVKLPNNYYTSILILGCSHWGNYCDKFQIKYTNGEYEDVYFNFEDWTCGTELLINTEWDGLVALEGQFGINKESRLINGGKAYLYVKEYNLKQRSLIDCVLLPDCQDIHIFGITLCK